MNVTDLGLFAGFNAEHNVIGFDRFCYKSDGDNLMGIFSGYTPNIGDMHPFISVILADTGAKNFGCEGQMNEFQRDNYEFKIRPELLRRVIAPFPTKDGGSGLLTGKSAGFNRRADD